MYIEGEVNGYYRYTLDKSHYKNNFMITIP